MKKLSIFLAVCLTLISCSSEEESLPIVDLHNTQRSKVIKLSELITDISVVRLETSSETLLGQYAQYAVSNKHIVTIDNEKILHFSSEGKYIRTLARGGKGPEEFVRVDAFSLDDENEILYINHRGDTKNIIAYDLKNGERIKRIPTGVDNIISNIISIEDSELVFKFKSYWTNC